MGELNIEEIEARAASVYPANAGWNGTEAEDALPVVTEDVPVLVAEVRRLRSEILCLDASVMDLAAERDALRAERAALYRPPPMTTIEGLTKRLGSALAEVDVLKGELAACGTFEATEKERRLREQAEDRARIATVTAERDALRASIAGRTTLPTEAEALAHDMAHGRWLVVSVNGHGSLVTDVCGLSAAFLDATRVARVYALDASLCLCAWPVVGTDRG